MLPVCAWPLRLNVLVSSPSSLRCPRMGGTRDVDKSKEMAWRGKERESERKGVCAVRLCKGETVCVCALARTCVSVGVRLGAPDGQALVCVRVKGVCVGVMCVLCGRAGQEDTALAVGRGEKGERNERDTAEMCFFSRTRVFAGLVLPPGRRGSNSGSARHFRVLIRVVGSRFPRTLSYTPACPVATL